MKEERIQRLLERWAEKSEETKYDVMHRGHSIDDKWAPGVRAGYLETL